MSKMDPIIASINDFFKNGIEGYDRLSKQTTNVGGARLYWQKDWKKREQIHISDPFYNAVKDFPSSLYVISRIRLDEAGRPMMVKDGTRFDRQTLGLMFYNQFNRISLAATKNKAKILADFPEITGFVFTGEELAAQIDSIKCVTEVDYYTPQQTRDKLRLEGCVFVIASSGSKNSAQIWGYNTIPVKDRTELNAQTTVRSTDADLSNLPV